MRKSISGVTIIAIVIAGLLCGCGKSEIKDKDVMACNLSIRCDTILQNISDFNEDKLELVPNDGIIFEKSEIEFQEGETAFDIIKREMTENKIHFEFEKSLAYDSVYIKGIGNIYEFDGGELSGWIFKVNGEVANCDSSNYKIQKDDKIEFVYSCNMGEDLGME